MDSTILAFSHASTIQRMMQYLVSKDLTVEKTNQRTMTKGLKNTMFNHIRITKLNESVTVKIVSFCNRDHLDSENVC